MEENDGAADNIREQAAATEGSMEGRYKEWDVGDSISYKVKRMEKLYEFRYV